MTKADREEKLKEKLAEMSQFENRLRAEGKERQPLVTMLAERGVDDEVGRSTDEREHTAHTAGKGQRH